MGEFDTAGWKVLMSSTVETATEIKPFHVEIPDAQVDDMRRRIAATNWPEKETVADQSQGVPLAMIQELAGYWGTEYDWRKCEATLNALPCRPAAEVVRHPHRRRRR